MDYFENENINYHLDIKNSLKFNPKLSQEEQLDLCKKAARSPAEELPKFTKALVQGKLAETTGLFFPNRREFSSPSDSPTFLQESNGNQLVEYSMQSSISLKVITTIKSLSNPTIVIMGQRYPVQKELENKGLMIMINYINEEYYKEGEKAFKLGKFDEAIDWFEKAYEETLYPAFLLNIAQCYKQLHRCDKAIFLYKQYKQSENVDQGVQNLIDACEEELKNTPTSVPVTPEPVPPPPFSLSIGVAVGVGVGSGSAESVNSCWHLPTFVCACQQR